MLTSCSLACSTCCIKTSLWSRGITCLFCRPGLQFWWSFSSSLFLFLIYWFERERERERGKKHWFVAPLFIHSLVDSCMCLDRGLNHNIGALGWCSNQLRYQAGAFFPPVLMWVSPGAWFRKENQQIKIKSWSLSGQLPLQEQHGRVP